MEEPGYTHPLGHTVSVDLGPRLDRRWKAASLRQRRELMAELHSIYRSLEDHHDTPGLSRLPPRPYTLLTTAPLAALQPHPPLLPAAMAQPVFLSAESDPPAEPPAETDPAPRNLLNRLLRGQAVDEAKLRELMEAPPLPPPVSPDTASMEQEMRERLGPIIDTLVEEHILGLKAELRFRLRAELESLISAAAKRP